MIQDRYALKMKISCGLHGAGARGFLGTGEPTDLPPLPPHTRTV
jgi:hypothetical protein